jgi:hypothetical protein
VTRQSASPSSSRRRRGSRQAGRRASNIRSARSIEGDLRHPFIHYPPDDLPITAQKLYRVSR